MSDEENFKECSNLIDESYDMSTWEHLTDVKYEGECIVYRRPLEGTGLYEYYAKGFFNGITAKAMFDSGMDTQYRTEWDNNTIKVEEIDKTDRGTCVYWQCKFPFPLSNRDYVYWRKTREEPEKNIFMMYSQSGPHEKMPEAKGFVRVDNYKSRMIVRQKDENSTEYALIYADDLKGSIPKWAVNWAVSTALPDFIKKLYTATKGYMDKTSK
eukprot:TRINITY_DN8870_c0_g1_i1.p1 TRINITY_DN8870_c0_g1~~TRINITY_DN8870_c0_g1_i1.p1  ORF type:complete len:212 (-),score=45.30 TRINITY_DN8870_c0_g1_i1:14-649(-)